MSFLTEDTSSLDTEMQDYNGTVKSKHLDLNTRIKCLYSEFRKRPTKREIVRNIANLLQIPQRVVKDVLRENHLPNKSKKYRKKRKPTQRKQKKTQRMRSTCCSCCKPNRTEYGNEIQKPPMCSDIELYDICSTSRQSTVFDNHLFKKKQINYPNRTHRVTRKRHTKDKRKKTNSILRSGNKNRSRFPSNAKPVTLGIWNMESNSEINEDPNKFCRMCMGKCFKDEKCEFIPLPETDRYLSYQQYITWFSDNLMEGLSMEDPFERSSQSLSHIMIYSDSVLKWNKGPSVKKKKKKRRTKR